MSTLLSSFGSLMAFGNFAFWLVAILLLLMAMVQIFWGDWVKYNNAYDLFIPSFSSESKFVQFVLRWSLVLILGLCPFVTSDYFFAELSIAFRIVFVYVAALFGFYISMIAWSIGLALFIMVVKVIYWACGKHFKLEGEN